MKKWQMTCINIVIIMGIASSAGAADPVVALVNDRPITSGELEEAVDQLIPRATFHGNLSDERRAEFREKALDELITAELQYQDAVARGMKPDRKQVKAIFKQVRDSFSSSREFKRWLEARSLTEDQLQVKIEKKVLIQDAINKIVIEPSRMSDKEVEEYYQQNKARFREPEKIRIRIITAKEERKAKDALERLAAGEDFGNVAARMSADNYRIKGGDIGFVHRGRIYPALENAAFAMKPGETSGIINTEGAWFLLKVEEKKPEHLVPYEEIKEKLKKDLEKKRATELSEQWMSGLKEKSRIEIKIEERSE